MDRRLLRFNGKVAHSSLRGVVDAAKFVAGDWKQVIGRDTPILSSPTGPRDRELLIGQEFCVLDTQDDHAFGFAHRDGYCGYVCHDNLGHGKKPTHVVSVRQTYKKKSPDLKKWEPRWPLSFGSRLTKTGVENGWAQVSMPSKTGSDDEFFVPNIHLKSVEWQADDTVSVAKLFLGSPYLWGGNTAYGIDCSGLVQAAMLACNIECPGDSDHQERVLGNNIQTGGSVLRGDLFFWKGHVAIALDETNLIHANAHHMSVVVEPIKETISRITEQGGGPVTSRKRL